MSVPLRSTELEALASWWRIRRRDGVTLAFTSHDRDIWLAGTLHRAAPGLTPAAIRRDGGTGEDSAEMTGALTHDAIRADDLAAGRFDGAVVECGALDWESGHAPVLYRGTIGTVGSEDAHFTAQLASGKAALAIDPVPRTSPSCRARFCGPGCDLSPTRFRVEATLADSDGAARTVRFDAIDPAPYRFGQIRWLSGPATGLEHTVIDTDGSALTLDGLPPDPPGPGTRALLTQGCDHTLATCADRFANAVNFRGEPYLPGNDLVARYPMPR